MINNFLTKGNDTHCIDDLKKNGYYVFKSKLKSNICEKYLKLINTLPKSKNHTTNFHNNAFMLYNLFNKDELFLKLIFQKKIISTCNNYFSNGAHLKDKNNFQFELMHSRIIQGKSKAQDLHIDSRVCGIDPPLMIHFFIYLSDVEKNSGATQLVPRSHKIKRYPTAMDKNKTIKIYGKKGTIIAINSSTWHGSSNKENEDQRAIITLAYSRWFIRQQFAAPYSIPKKIIQKLTKKEKIILGFENYAPVDENKRVRARGDLPKYIF